MSLNRRQLLSAGLASGALLFGRPAGVLASPLLASTGSAASRASRLFPGTALAHADLHNHSLLSDGDGRPEDVFTKMRGYGLDVAALTDHATTSRFAKPPCGENGDCHSLFGIDEASWQKVHDLAHAASADGTFTALRGFEWSSPTLGHMNVWFSEKWIDPASTGGAGTAEGLGQHMQQELPGLGPTLGPVVDQVVRAAPTNGSAMRPFYEWLTAAPTTPAIGGGADGLAGFNHPGREPGRFGYFHYDSRLRDRIVSMEIFNRREDYLFEGVDMGQPSPLVECLDAGWRVGLIGVSDEHGTDWGNPGDGLDLKGRAGVWLGDLSRDGVREAMAARRFFATVIDGLRVDAAATTAAGATGRMGQTLAGAPGRTTFVLDVARGDDWVGKRLNVQVLTSDRPLPKIVEAVEVAVPAPDQPLITIDVDLGTAAWAVLRVSDPTRAAHGGRDRGTAFEPLGRAIAYTSPFYFQA